MEMRRAKEGARERGRESEERELKMGRGWHL